MDADEIRRMMAAGGLPDMETAQESALDAIISVAEKWQEDTPTHKAARAMMSSLRPMMEAMKDPNEIHPLVFTMLLKNFTYAATTLRQLESLTDLKKEL